MDMTRIVDEFKCCVERLSERGADNSHAYSLKDSLLIDIIQKHPLRLEV